MKKQILLIGFPILTIVAGLFLSINYNAFDFLIPIILTSMFSNYFLCYMENKVNFSGMSMYVVALILTFILSFLYLPSYGEIRFIAMKIMSVLFVIMGGLAGVILRYKFYCCEKQKANQKNDKEC